MKIMVLGITGMLGSELYKVLNSESKHDICGTSRQSSSNGKVYGLNAADNKQLKSVIVKIRPDVVVNCIGIVKSVVDDHIQAITINSLFPHCLAKLCTEHKIRLIHISTDCVFSGKKGNYSEEDTPDPVDLYGISKLAGEVTYGNHLTIRTSIIGREPGSKKGLLEWFLSQQGTVKGYKNAVWTGLTTTALSRVIIKIIDKHPGLNGLINIAGEQIDKYSLLKKLKKAFKKDVKIKEFKLDAPVDRSLSNKKLNQLGITVPSIDEMINELAGG